jgi:uncharacterized protein (DUF2249 family)
MSTDTAAPTRTASSNAQVIAAIKAHHRELAGQLHRLTEELTAAARSGAWERERNGLVAWYRSELLPHAAAEEKALYNRGAELDGTRLLVRAMIDEHHAIIATVDALDRASDTIGVVAVAGAASLLFDVHLTKENDLLLPALDATGVDLAAALEGMHELLGGHADEHGHDDGGCGCGCGHEQGSAPQTLSIGHRPPPAPAFEPAAEGELDVRLLPHGARHDIIFGKLNALAVDEALVIVNDHDPKPLRYQTEALWPGCFEWSYLAAGPQVWRVAITRVD